MHLARFGHNPRLLFRGGTGRGEGIFLHFDADGEAELVISGQRGQACTGGGQSGQAGAKLGFEVGGGSSPSVGDGDAGLVGGILPPVVKGGVHLARGDAREAGQVEGISFEGLVRAKGGDDDADGGNGALEDLGIDRDGGVVDVVTHLGVTGLSDGIIIGPDG